MRMNQAIAVVTGIQTARLIKLSSEWLGKSMLNYTNHLNYLLIILLNLLGHAIV